MICLQRTSKSVSYVGCVIPPLAAGASSHNLHRKSLFEGLCTVRGVNKSPQKNYCAVSKCLVISPTKRGQRQEHTHLQSMDLEEAPARGLVEWMNCVERPQFYIEPLGSSDSSQHAVLLVPACWALNRVQTCRRGRSVYITQAVMNDSWPRLFLLNSQRDHFYCIYKYISILYFNYR